MSGSVRGGTEPALQRSYSTKCFTAAAAAAARCDVLHDSIHPAARAACPIICITTTHVGLRLRTTECWQLTFQSTKRANPRQSGARYAFTGWSAQRDKYGAFKLKPSEARFQLVDKGSRQGMTDDHDRCEWLNVSSGTGSPGFSWTESSSCVLSPKADLVNDGAV